jgi:hypothetical protein
MNKDTLSTSSIRFPATAEREKNGDFSVLSVVILAFAFLVIYMLATRLVSRISQKYGKAKENNSNEDGKR